MHVDVVALVSGSSRPELPPAHVTIGPASRVAASRNLESTAPGMSSSNNVYDRKSLFIGENGNAFLGPHHHQNPLL